MNMQSGFLIPIMGLKVGLHKVHFDVDHDFVNKYKATQITQADIGCDVDIDISATHIEIDVTVQGTIRVPCDRCLQKIDLPIYREFDLVAKYGEGNKEEDEVIYIARNESNLDLEQPLYDLIRLALPLVNVYDCEEDDQPPCDQEILAKLSMDEEDDEIDRNQKSIWDDIKNEIK